jgi:hypothetical protein
MTKIILFSLILFIFSSVAYAEVSSETTITNETMPNDLYNWLTTDLDSSVLTIDISYEGGCADHGFELVWDGSLSKSQPPQANVILSHDSMADACTDLVNQKLLFDLSPIRERYQVDDPDSTELTINFVDYDGEQHKFDYIFATASKDAKVFACTMDAMVCPDGSTVGRDPDNDCAFFACPNEQPSQTAKCSKNSDCENELRCISYPVTGPVCALPNPCDNYQCPKGTHCIENEGTIIAVTCDKPLSEESDKTPTRNQTEPIMSAPDVEVTATNNATVNDSVQDQPENVTIIIDDALIPPSTSADGRKVNTSKEENKAIKVYIQNEYRDVRLFYFIPFRMRVEMTLDSTTGEIISEKLPWWAFLAKI